MLIGAAVVVVAVAIGAFVMSGGDGGSTTQGAVDAAGASQTVPTQTTASGQPGSGTEPVGDAAVAAPPVGTPGNARPSGDVQARSASAPPSPVSGGPAAPAAAVTLPVSESDAVLEARRALAQTMRRLNAAEDEAFVAESRRAIPELQSLLRQFRTASDSAQIYILLAPAYGAVDDMPQACIALKYAKRVAAPGVQRQQIDGLASSAAFSVCPP